MAPIRAWSFTRLWAVTAVIWVVAGGAAAVADYFDALGMAVAGLGFLPAFLAGAWAGEHPEIREWPRVRLIAMWVLLGIGFVGATDFIDHWKLAAAVGAAPAAILTLRWYELITAGRGPSLPAATTTEPRIPAAQTGNGPAQG
jgi:hypothetical protein